MNQCSSLQFENGGLIPGRRLRWSIRKVNWCDKTFACSFAPAKPASCYSDNTIISKALGNINILLTKTMCAMKYNYCRKWSAAFRKSNGCVNDAAVCCDVYPIKRVVVFSIGVCIWILRLGLVVKK